MLLGTRDPDGDPDIREMVPSEDDTYPSSADAGPTDRIEAVPDSPGATVAEHAAQHFPTCTQSLPELTAWTVVVSVLVPPTTLSPVDVEYASTTTVSMVVDRVRTKVVVMGVWDCHVSVMVLVMVTVNSVVQGSSEPEASSVAWEKWKELARLQIGVPMGVPRVHVRSPGGIPQTLELDDGVTHSQETIISALVEHEVEVVVVEDNVTSEGIGVSSYIVTHEVDTADGVNGEAFDMPLFL